MSSRAFTIVFILLGASVVGGALALFVEDAVKGAADAHDQAYRRLLEQDAFRRFDRNGDGVLSYSEFDGLLRWAGYGLLSDGQRLQLCQKFDPIHTGVISYSDFMYVALAHEHRTRA